MQVIAFTLILSYLRPRPPKRFRSTRGMGCISLGWAATDVRPHVSFGSRGAPGALGELIKIVGPEWGIRKRDDSPYHETWLCFYCKIFTYFTSKLDGLLLKLAKICRSTPYHIMYIIYIHICVKDLRMVAALSEFLQCHVGSLWDSDQIPMVTTGDPPWLKRAPWRGGHLDGHLTLW